jgi:hypothetical protein
MHVRWVKLHRSSYGLLLSQFPSLKVGPLEPLFAPWVGMDPSRADPLPDEEQKQLLILESAWNSLPISEENKGILDKAHFTIRRVFSLLVNCPHISKLSSVMAWFSMISEEYLKMLEDKVPEALLIVAYYCVALKKAENMWWLRGKGENLLNTVLAELGPGWERWTAWPVEQVLGRDEGVGRGFRIDGMLIDG